MLARLAAHFAKLWSAVATEPPLWEGGRGTATLAQTSHPHYRRYRMQRDLNARLENADAWADFSGYENHNGSDLFVALPDPNNLQGKCGRCEFRHICGGSRARAWTVNGNVFADDPLCAYEPGLVMPLPEALRTAEA